MSLLALKSFSSVPVGANGVISHAVTQYIKGSTQRNIDFYDQEILVEGNGIVFRLNKDTLAVNSAISICLPATPSNMVGTTGIVLNNGNMFYMGDHYAYTVTPGGANTAIGRFENGAWYLIGQLSKRLSNGDFIVAARYFTGAGSEYISITRMDQSLNVVWAKVVQEAYSHALASGEFCIELADGTLCFLYQYYYSSYMTACVTFMNSAGIVLKNIALYTDTRGNLADGSTGFIKLPNGRLMIFLTNSAAGSKTSTLVLDPATYQLESVKTFTPKLDNADVRIVTADISGDGYLYLGTDTGHLVKCSLTVGGQISAVIWAKKIVNTDNFDYFYGGHSLKIQGDFIYIRRAVSSTKRMFFMKLPLNNIPNGVYSVGNGSITITDATVSAFTTNTSHTTKQMSLSIQTVTLSKALTTEFSPTSLACVQAQINL